jgi:hypothetical protein
MWPAVVLVPPAAQFIAFVAVGGDLAVRGAIVLFVLVSLALMGVGFVILARAAGWPRERLRRAAALGLVSGLIWFALVVGLLYLAVLECAAENAKCLS